MKKPINRIAVGLWALAVVLASQPLWSLYRALRMGVEMNSPGQTYIVVNTVWNMDQSSIFIGAMLGTMGYLVELADQIRWQTRK